MAKPALMFIVAIAAALPAPAAAGDPELSAVVKSQVKELARVGVPLARSVDRLVRRNGRSPQGARRALKRARESARKARIAILRETPTTDAGRAAQKSVIAGYSDIKGSLVSTSRVIDALVAKRAKDAVRRYKRAARLAEAGTTQVRAGAERLERIAKSGLSG